MKFKTIVIDPPWPGPNACPTFSCKTKIKNVVIPYSTMTGIQCAALRIQELAADDAQLWLWMASRNCGDAFLLAQLWGFSYRALFIWKKPLGMGRHTRHQAEFLLWAGRPGARLVEPRKCPHQIQEWPKPKAHSEKPAQAYEFIKGLSDEPRIDIFAKQVRPGFARWGDQAPEE